MALFENGWEYCLREEKVLWTSTAQASMPSLFNGDDLCLEMTESSSS
jgi:hypothetical protein